jgi:hypothetical protein
MKKWKVEFEIAVSNNWIEDGFDMKEYEEHLNNFLESELLPYSYTNEVIVTKMEIDEINN